MPSAQPNYPLLAIDTCSKLTWVGLKTDASSLLERSDGRDPSKSLFPLVSEALDQAGLRLEELRSIVFCEGPGSMLGARTAVMTLRAWQGIGIPAANTVFAYHSLALGQALCTRSAWSDSSALVVSDARRNSWYGFPHPSSPSSQIELFDNDAIEAETRRLVSFPEFARWTKTKATLHELPYRPGELFSGDEYREIIRPVEQAAPLALRPSDFKKWIPTIHSAQNA
ncbi:hypothetical protein [Pelagicoccus sp. SDUM812003]|uniref:hypothetical protein n=1 Tax=Pelagicoccus sp. SDUM812003 TaxID=3041267 RepID=UPI00280CC951|nr:hypothetical protein [Pelagicoccus sp. SDUM812003]MDQ8203311.1 hypothetical protein [Pelagicoccus sp. SDUM812003]